MDAGVCVRRASIGSGHDEEAGTILVTHFQPLVDVLNLYSLL